MPTTAFAQSLSGEVEIHSQYLDEDGFVYTDEPVIQAGLYLEVAEGFTLEAWGSHGFTTKEGAELDLGVSYTTDVGEAEVTVSANRYLLQGPDITALEAKAVYGPVDVIVSYYAWDHNPDAIRVVTGYTFNLSESTEVRPLLVYETGFGEPDIFGAGLSAIYGLTDNLSLVGTVIAPINSGSGRTIQAAAGISFGF